MEKSKGMGYYFKIMLDGSRKLYKKIPLEDNYEFEDIYLVNELYKVIEDKINNGSK